MNCSEIRENLSAYMDRELTAEDAQVVKKHLEKCPDCCAELQELEKTAALLSSLKEVIPPARLRRDIRSKLENYQTVNKTETHPSKFIGFINKFFSGVKYRRLAPAVIVVALMLVIIPLALQENIKLARNDEAAARNTAPQSFALNSKLKNNDLISGAPAEAGKGEDGRAADTATYFSFTDKAEMESSQAPTPGAPPMPAPAAPPRASITATSAAEKTEPVSSVMDRKIIKNANLSLEVENYQTAAEKVKEKVNAMGGYIANESVNVAGPEEGILSGHLNIRIPHHQFEPFLSGMESLGKVKNRNIYSQDVSEEFVDVESRLNAMTVKEERLLSILQKSGQLSDVLAVETELANTRAEKESLQGRLRYLNNRVELSSISINIQQVQASTQKISTGGLEGVIERAREAFVQAINSILIGFGKLIVLVSSALPYLFLIALTGLGVWQWMKRKTS